jgi:hypothetical protein
VSPAEAVNGHVSLAAWSPPAELGLPAVVGAGVPELDQLLRREEEAAAAEAGSTVSVGELASSAIFKCHPGLGSPALASACVLCCVLCVLFCCGVRVLCCVALFCSGLSLFCM